MQNEDRIQRIEESQAFAERDAEVLGNQVVRLQQQVAALAQRIAQLEGLLGRIAGGGQTESGHEPSDGRADH